MFNSQTNEIKDLSFLALFALIFGSMIGSGIFDVPQNVASSAGVVAIVIGWVVTTVGVFALSFAFIYITRKRPDIKSGIYGYAKHGFGDYMGFNAAWGYALNSLLANACYLIYICATLGNFALFKFLGTGNTISSLVVQSVLIWAVFFLVRWGVKEASSVNTVITLLKIGMIVAILVAFALAFDRHTFISNIHQTNNFGSITTQVKSMMLIAVWNFTGIEAACIFAMRAKKTKDIINATMLGAATVCAICFLISILPFGFLTGASIGKMATPSASGILAAYYGVFSANLVRIAVIVSVVGALLVWTMLSSNIFYLSALDKTMPAIFSRLNHKNVPTNALILSSIAAQIFILLAYFTNQVYLGMLQLATSLVLLPYLLSALFAMKLIITDKKLDFIALLKGFLAVLYGIWVVYSGGMKYLALSSILYLCGALFYFWARGESKKKIFANKWELLLFLVFTFVTIIALTKYPHAILNPSATA